MVVVVMGSAAGAAGVVVAVALVETVIAVALVTVAIAVAEVVLTVVAEALGLAFAACLAVVAASRRSGQPERKCFDRTLRSRRRFLLSLVCGFLLLLFLLFDVLMANGSRNQPVCKCCNWTGR